MSKQNDQDLLSKESLGYAQAKNLNDLEEYAEKLGIKVFGVNILIAFSYNFIQILNNMYLSTILDEIETYDECVTNA